MVKKENITPSSIDMPNLPLATCTRFGNLVFVGAHMPKSLARNPADMDVREQTYAHLEGIKLCLEEAGTSMENVLTASCFLTDRNNFKIFNEEWVKFFPTDPPVRTTTEVQLMNPHILVEIRVTACIPD